MSALVFKTSGGRPRGGPGGFDSHALPPLSPPSDMTGTELEAAHRVLVAVDLDDFDTLEAILRLVRASGP